MAKVRSKKVNTSVEEEAELDPIAESRELERDQSAMFSADFVQPQEEAAHIILTRENLILIGPGLWKYTHDEKGLGACASPTAFKGQMAANFGVRPGDHIQCGSIFGGKVETFSIAQDDKE